MLLSRENGLGWEPFSSGEWSTTSEQRRDDRRRVTDVMGLKVGWLLPVNLGGTTGIFGALVPFGMRAPFLCLMAIVLILQRR